MDRKKKSPSWTVVVIWFIVFWPVGFYMIYKKLANDKSAAMKNSKVLKTIGYFFLFCAVSLPLVEIGSESGNNMGSILTCVVFYTVGGILLVRGGKKLQKSGERYKKLIEIVINQQQYTIENIAAQMGLDYGETVDALQGMIDKDYFAGAYIDLANHELVFPDRFQQTGYHANQNLYAEVNAGGAPQQKVVKCPNCGGKNIITAGQVSECDYCGSPIQ